MVGFLLQWPTLITLAMFPILVVMYIRLARREEREVAAEFGTEYARYASVTPGFIPHLNSLTGAQPTSPRDCLNSKERRTAMLSLNATVSFAF